MKILAIGDQHFRDNLGYSEYISDGRKGEKKEILDFIIKESKDCDHIVLMGDNFNSKNNSSETNREYVEFLERFEDKEVYVISGNHEKKGDGKTAIDFLGEVRKQNWHIFTKPNSIELGKLKVDFLPYMLNSELEVDSCEEATKHIMKHLDGGDILFAHHAISGTTFNGIKTDLFKEIVLPKEKLEKKYKLVVAGHIHTPQQYGNVVITGSLFTNEMGDTEKYIWKIDEKLNVEKIRVPAREIHKIENPTLVQLTEYPKNSIVKIVLTDKKIDTEEIKIVASGFDAYLLVEDYPSTRKKAHLEEGKAFDFSIEALLKLYAEEKGIDLQKLLTGLQLINA